MPAPLGTFDGPGALLPYPLRPCQERDAYVGSMARPVITCSSKSNEISDHHLEMYIEDTACMYKSAYPCVW
jgi:hypothetical protein